MKLAPLLLCAWLAVTAVVVIVVGNANARQRPPRAAVILERQVAGTWICPDRHPPARGPVVAWGVCAH